MNTTGTKHHHHHQRSPTIPRQQTWRGVWDISPPHQCTHLSPPRTQGIPYLRNTMLHLTLPGRSVLGTSRGANSSRNAVVTNVRRFLPFWRLSPARCQSLRRTTGSLAALRASSATSVSSRATRPIPVRSPPTLAERRWPHLARPARARRSGVPWSSSRRRATFSVTR